MQIARIFLIVLFILYIPEIHSLGFHMNRKIKVTLLISFQLIWIFLKPTEDEITIKAEFLFSHSL